MESHHITKEVKEIKIDVPWGYMAAKWWGPQNIRPIVALHGRELNAGTFDCLIPLLPNHISYLAIDLPGHGLSSQIPLGQVYSTEFYLYIFRLIRAKFQWSHLSLLAHSMSSVHSFIYAALFPNEVDMIIGISFLRPHVLTAKKSIEIYKDTIKNTVQTDIRAQESNSESPSYNYEEMVQNTMKVIGSNGNRKPAEIFLHRGIHRSNIDPTKFCYSRDRRVRVYFWMVSRDVSLEMMKQIKMPHCFIIGRDEEDAYSHIEDLSYFKEAIANMSATNPNFEYHTVAGGHYVHLVEIQPTAQIISDFINKYRPPNESLVSKI